MRRLPLALVSAGLLLAACSGGSSPTVTGPPSTSPSAITTSSAPTSPAATTAPAPTATAAKPAGLSWHGCGSGFECSTLTVPLDAAKPGLGTVGLALTRHKATGRRIGSLLVNPGGPGASAVDFAQAAYSSLPQTLRQHFDIAAFDPRGVGHTAPVVCLSTSQLDSYFHIDPVPDTAAERSALDAGNKQLDQGCKARSGRILPYASTVIVAQDMDRVRAALGDSKLTYLGYSYGTAIGASYLDQFPTHVRAMVLDGALDPTLTWDQLLAGQSQGFDGALTSFMKNCQATNCEFRQAVKGDLLTAYDDLQKSIESRELPGIGARKLGVSEFLLGVGQGMYSTSLWPYLASALAQAEQGNGNKLMLLSDNYLERSGSGYSNLQEAILAVNCIDRPWPRADAPYYALADKVAKTYPRFGPAIALSGLACGQWPLGPVSKPHPVSGKGSPKVIVIGTTRDPATPYMWAQGLAKQLDGGVLLTHNGDGHTVFRDSAPSCIKNPVDDYFVSLKVPAAGTC